MSDAIDSDMDLWRCARDYNDVYFVLPVLLAINTVPSIDILAVEGISGNMML